MTQRGCWQRGSCWKFAAAHSWDAVGLALEPAASHVRKDGQQSVRARQCWRSVWQVVRLSVPDLADALKATDAQERSADLAAGFCAKVEALESQLASVQAARDEALAHAASAEAARDEAVAKAVSAKAAAKEAEQRVCVAERKARRYQAELLLAVAETGESV